MGSTHKFTTQNYMHLFLLTAAGAALLLLMLPGGHLFGSETDWLSQHVTIADYMRRQFYATGDLLPDFSGLGGGSNFYTLSYYGFLRPDVLLSYFLPGVSMAAIIQGYAVFEIFLGAFLLYLWLCRHDIRPFFCLAAGMLYLCSGCLFQAHRQIMFVNYLPFLILAFLSIDNMTKAGAGKSHPLVPHTGLLLSMAMMLLHSFYFFPACFIACVLYLFQQQKETPQKGAWKKFLTTTILSVSMAMILLLPTGLAILENKKDVKGASLLELLCVRPDFTGLLYSPYGCGLTILVLYTLFLSIHREKTRVLSLFLLCFAFFPVFQWLLNGTLYARPKSLIPFVPLLLFLAARTMDELSRKKIRHSLPLALLCMIPVLLQAAGASQIMLPWIILDGLCLLLYVAAGQRSFQKKEIPRTLNAPLLRITALALLLASPAMLSQIGRAHV